MSWFANLRLVFIVGLMALPVSALSEPSPALRIGGNGFYELQPALSQLDDAAGDLGIEEVAAAATQARFKPVPQHGAGINFGFRDSALWLRVTLDVPVGGDPHWLLELAYPPLDRLELWTREGAGPWTRQLAGDALPVSGRAIAHRNHLLQLTLTPGTVQTLYLRLSSQGTVAAPLRLWRPEALGTADQRSYLAFGVYFGLLGGLLLYNLLLFVAIRERAYLYHVAFVGSIMLSQAALTGLGRQFLWPDWLQWNAVAPPVGISVAALFGMQFARGFLSTALRTPRIDHALKLLMGCSVLTFAVTLGGHYTLAVWMLSVAALVAVALLMVCGVVGVRQQDAGARQFLLAWTVLLAGAVVLALHNIGLAPTNALTLNALSIGSALEALLLSFALAARINVARRFKEQAQARLAAERAMVESLRQAHQRLQQVVREREVILHNSLVGIAFLTPQGRIRWANRAMRQMFGLPREPGSSTEPFYLSRSHYLRVGGEVASAVSRGESYEREMDMRGGDGVPFRVRVSGRAADPASLSNGTVWVVMDLTRQVPQDRAEPMDSAPPTAPIGVF